MRLLYPLIVGIVLLAHTGCGRSNEAEFAEDPAPPPGSGPVSAEPAVQETLPE